MSIASGKPTYQSTTVSDSGQSAYAVDDDATTCSSTNSKAYNYLEIDLKETMAFVEVSINNTNLGSKKI